MMTQSEEQLSESERRVRQVADAAPTAMIFVTSESRIAFANLSTEQLFGYLREELSGRAVEELIPEWLHHAHAEAGDAELRGPDRPPMRSGREILCVHKDGTEVPVRLTLTFIDAPSGRLTLASVQHNDEQNLGERRFRTVVEGAPNGILVTSAGGKISLVNQKAGEIFGYSREELLGQPIETLVPERCRPLHGQHVAAFRHGGEERKMGAGRELSGRRKDGSEVAVEIGLRQIDMPDGPATLVSVIDVTDRKVRDNEIRRSNSELEQFAHVASHDLQEPLRMVASYTELLGRRYKGQLDERADKYIFYAVDGARRMQQLVSDILAYSRIGSQGKPLVVVDSGVAVKSVVHGLGALLRETDTDVIFEDLPTVLADEVQLRQLFQNLIGNAVKFRGESPPVVRIGAERVRDEWVFSVADNGIGMDMQYSERIFEMFQRLHERGKYDGSGIGLSLAKRIVERHGGRIWLESRLGAGTTFFFTLRPPPARGES